MKFFTVPVVNKKKRSFKTFIFGQSAEQKHYRAQHCSEDISLLWLEASQFGKLHTFPCVLTEGEDMLVFRSASSKATAKQNAMLIQRWNLFVNPENIQTDYHVEEMARKDFYAMFNECQRKLVQMEIDAEETAVEPCDQSEDTADESVQALPEAVQEEQTEQETVQPQ